MEGSGFFPYIHVQTRTANNFKGPKCYKVRGEWRKFVCALSIWPSVLRMLIYCTSKHYYCNGPLELSCAKTNNMCIYIYMYLRFEVGIADSVLQR